MKLHYLLALILGVSTISCSCHGASDVPQLVMAAEKGEGPKLTPVKKKLVNVYIHLEDSYNNPLKYYDVFYVSKEDEIKGKVKTDKKGRAVIRDIPSGSYEIYVYLGGDIYPWDKTSIWVGNVNRRLNIKFPLKLWQALRNEV